MFAYTGKSFRERIQESGRLVWLGIRLAWRASPKALIGIILLLALQATLSPVELALSRNVIDRAALDLGFRHQVNPLAARFPLGVWIAFAAIAIATGHLIQLFSSTCADRWA